MVPFPFSVALNDPNSDVKDTPLVDVEYLRNGTRQTHGYYRPLIESYMCGLLNCTVAVTYLQGHLSYFYLKINVAYFSCL